MLGVCLLVAGVTRAALPTTEFSVAWTHSVEKTRWEEHYRIEGDGIALVEAGVQGFGAGMEPPPGAELHDGWWRWRPKSDATRELRLTYSSFTADYSICWRRHCNELGDVLGQRPLEGDVIGLQACELREPKPVTR